MEMAVYVLLILVNFGIFLIAIVLNLYLVSTSEIKFNLFAFVCIINLYLTITMSIKFNKESEIDIPIDALQAETLDSLDATSEDGNNHIHSVIGPGGTGKKRYRRIKINSSSIVNNLFFGPIAVLLVFKHQISNSALICALTVLLGLYSSITLLTIIDLLNDHAGSLLTNKFINEYIGNILQRN